MKNQEISKLTQSVFLGYFLHMVPVQDKDDLNEGNVITIYLKFTDCINEHVIVIINHVQKSNTLH